MSKNKKNTNRKGTNKYLVIVAVVAVVLAGGIVAYKNISVTSRTGEQQVLQADNADGKLEIPTESLSEKVSFVDYNYNGTDMQLMLLKTNDGKIRCALNTCQVCNGSPYAYFVQDGDAVICQNCGNSFVLSEIGQEHGGCNPVPFEFTEEDGKVVIETALLDSVAPAFTNWKKGVE